MRSSRLFPLAASLALSVDASDAVAHCRTTTCNAEDQTANCRYDANGCPTQGIPLYWPGDCLWFGVQQDGSAKRHITYDTFHSVVANAFKKWANADCGGGQHPIFGIQDTDLLYGPAVCEGAEYNKTTANANVWMFRDTEWPYMDSGSTIALTTLTIEPDTGRIRDADVELNSYAVDITVSNTSVGADLDSIVTHESGHFLGLAHSLDQQATMYADYSPSTISIRTLSPDDEEGICSIYPSSGNAPSCGEPDPLSGFSRYCGGANPSTQPAPVATRRSCSVGAVPAANAGLPWACAAASVVAGAALCRRRLRRQTSAR